MWAISVKSQQMQDSLTYLRPQVFFASVVFFLGITFSFSDTPSVLSHECSFCFMKQKLDLINELYHYFSRHDYRTTRYLFSLTLNLSFRCCRFLIIFPFSFRSGNPPYPLPHGSYVPSWNTWKENMSSTVIFSTAFAPNRLPLLIFSLFHPIIRSEAPGWNRL